VTYRIPSRSIALKATAITMSTPRWFESAPIDGGNEKQALTDLRNSVGRRVQVYLLKSIARSVAAIYRCQLTAEQLDTLVFVFVREPFDVF
jgi:hypothetical protein